MVDTTVEELVIDEPDHISVRLNVIEPACFQITCSREIIGGYSIAITYRSHDDVRRVLRSFGFENYLINDRINKLIAIKPATDLVWVGERKIPTHVLRVEGFLAV